ncbi:anthranilate phosphoribosyltransferase [Occultella glacieicola]|uniref:Anthranilate phosphoribosyltransferase n=1 Tax=Occultella glacieicola TaxID=2518684 RepID=A0ABY2DXU9_9MICO|nr:anthranilate phosphoribosyltransferase [Occultella glacieicola]TDE88959.1 anthranilate phosphoribosyltransferase [Occultella glacieicola]
MTAPAADEGRTWPELIVRLLGGADLSAAETSWAMDEVMSGNTSPVTLAGFLVALAAKGETVPEVRGLADSMIAHAVPIEVPGDAVDIVGTGGDRHRSVNISTMAAIVVAGTGIRVVKHGNRASSSASGSADVLEALGVRLDLDPAAAARVVGEAGITFLFANHYHPAMRHAAVARRDLGVPTAFNVLGPLTNPAQPRAGAIGVGNARMAPIMAGVFAERGNSSLVFRSEDGLDELATTAPARVWEVTAATGGLVREHEVDPVTAFGMTRATLDDIRGADATFNAGVARDLLVGRTGAIRDAVLLNAAAALVADGTRPGTAEGDLLGRLRAGLALAAGSIDDGAAAGVLERWVTASNA